MQEFDREADYQAGYEDGKFGFPRESTRPYYRKGYDKGLTELCAAEARVAAIISEQAGR